MILFEVLPQISNKEHNDDRTTKYRPARLDGRAVIWACTSFLPRTGWLAFFRDLVARGLTGVALVTSDAHRGLVEAIGAKPG